MSQKSALLDPLLDAREVVESYLGAQYELQDWEETLEQAATRLSAIAQVMQSGEVHRVAEQVRAVLDHGLRGDIRVVQALSSEVARLVEELRIPGLPRPDDDDWSF